MSQRSLRLLLMSKSDNKASTFEGNKQDMSNLEEYFALVKKHPQLFVNPPGGEIALLLDEGEIREVEAQMRQWLELKGLPDEWAEVGIAYPDTGASSECNEFFYAEI